MQASKTAEVGIKANYCQLIPARAQTEPFVEARNWDASAPSCVNMKAPLSARSPSILPKGFLHACLWHSTPWYAIQAAEKKAKQELAAAQQASKASQDGLAALGRELADANAKASCPNSFHVHDSGMQHRQFPSLRRILWRLWHEIGMIMRLAP